jgi:nicotinamidase-related amidase
MAIRTTSFIIVDFQKDFTESGGAHYKARPCVDFIKGTLVSFLRENHIKMAEIISDYRQPRPGRKGDFCRPGTNGYLSDIPGDVKKSPVWIKAANSPLWTRQHIGEANKQPGLPYQDPAGFDAWLDQTVGKPEDTDIILCGVTIDRCVLCTAQELYFRGYTVSILDEATDSYSGDQKEKAQILHGPIVSNWAKPITWQEIQGMLSNT